jgi:hypothetical protein
VEKWLLRAILEIADEQQIPEKLQKEHTSIQLIIAKQHVL